MITDEAGLERLKDDLSENIKAIILSNSIRGTLHKIVKTIPIYTLEDVLDFPAKNLPNLNKLKDWAYMIYTSGSTGNPKGAILRYDGLFNQLFSKIVEFGLSDGFTMLQSAPISSDISVWQFLGPLCCGGTVVIADRSDENVSNQLYKIISKEQINVVELIPAVAELLIDHITNQEEFLKHLSSLKILMLCGEEVPKYLVNKYLKALPFVRVYNAYGPAEASDDVTLYEVPGIIEDYVEKVAIGRPVRNMKIYVLDNFGELVPHRVSW